MTDVFLETFCGGSDVIPPTRRVKQFGIGTDLEVSLWPSANVILLTFFLLLTLEIDFFFHEDPAYTLGCALPFSVTVASEGGELASQGMFKKVLNPTKSAPTSCKWSYNPYTSKIK